jgi:catechol 2,3-dioxygenase-like lactoylglutathione lyase family enzyme
VQSARCCVAGVSLNGVRVGASDPAVVASFYRAAFGMQEVQRIRGLAIDPAGNHIELVQGAGQSASQ